MRMKELRPFEHPISLGKNKRNLRTQFGALCYRVIGDKTQVLLVTSRNRGRWIIPKGWPQNALSATESAAAEAWEEAGVEGRAKPVCLGVYSYAKEIGEKKPLPCMVAVFPIKVRKLRAKYPEQHQRRRKWFSLKKAAKRVQDPELSALLRNFDPRRI